MKPETKAEAEAWLAKARTDLRAAQVDIAASPPILSDALFHLSQNEQQPFKTHDLEALAARCGRLMPHLGELIRKSHPRLLLP
jgi:hypothetical protein